MDKLENNLKLYRRLTPSQILVTGALGCSLRRVFNRKDSRFSRGEQISEYRAVKSSPGAVRKISRTRANELLVNRIISCFFVCVCIVCHLLRGGVAAIFGPQSAHTASHVQSICDTMEIPHLETRWDYRIRRQSCLVNLYPHPTTLSKVGTNFRCNSLIKAATRPRKICLPLLWTSPRFAGISCASWWGCFASRASPSTVNKYHFFF